MSTKGASRSSSTEESYTNTNFWGLDGYKNTVKRLEDGAQLCDEFMKMVHERADIEMKYTMKLREWSKRWTEKINGKISEYGTMLEAFRATLREAEEVAEIHVERHNRLKADLCDSIKQWKNQHYHKSVLKWKEVKECETGFSKIHEPWARKYHKMDKAKKNFHRASKNSEQASILASNAEKEGGMPEKVKKLNDNSMKLKCEVDEAKKKYERRLTEMNSSNEVYADELEEEFNKWERFEKVRLTFFKDALERYHNVLDMSENERLPNIYKGLISKIRVADSVKDLKWWSVQYGPGMLKKWPEFEEPKEWTLSRNKPVKRQSLIRRLSQRRRNNKRQQKPLIPAETHVDLDHDRSSRGQHSSENVESLSDSFTGSADFHWSGDDGSPNNNRETGGHSRSSHYQSPSNTQQQTSTFLDAHYKSPTIIDEYNDAWNRSSTFGSAAQAPCDRPSCQKPVGITYYSYGASSSRDEYDSNPSTNANAKGYSLSDGVEADVENATEGLNSEDAAKPETGSSYNPFDEDDGVEENSGKTDINKVNGEVADNAFPEYTEDVPGIPVRAKYDYEASEEDELSFHCGDIITQLSGEDGQGWCKGKLNGVEGLFPAKWVEAV